MSEAVFVINTEMDILYANPAAETLTGYSSGEAIGVKCEDIFCEPSERCRGFCPPKIAMRQQEAILHREAVTKMKDGRLKNTQISFSPFYDSGSCIGAVVVIKDITEIRQAEERIRSQNRFLSLTINSLPDPFYVIDASTYRITLANRASGASDAPEDATCYALLHGKTLPCGDEHHPCPLDMVKKTGLPCVVEHQHQDSSGQTRSYEVHGYPILDDQGNVIRMIEHALDVTERRRTEKEKEEMREQLRILSITDELTGLYSRRGFFSLAEHQLKIAERSRKELFLLYMDVDNLKTVNDRLGHSEGDQVITRIAAVLRSCFRVSDILARIGGDEFVVLPMEADEGTPAAVISRIEAAIESANREGSAPYELSLSIGSAASRPDDRCSLDELLKRADLAMYEAKAKKKMSR